MHERFNDISILRCSAMLMIVFYHCLCAYGVWDDTNYSADFSVPLWDVFIAIMRNIHLPLFFIIAGFLFGYKRILGGYGNLMKFTKDKFIRVMLPYFIVGIIIVVVQKIPVKSLFYGISHLWFLMTIFECYLFGRIIDFVLRTEYKWRIILLLICCLVITFQEKITVNMWGLTIRQFCQYFPFYLIGMIFGTMNFHKNKSSYYECAVMICSLLLMIATACINKSDGPLRFLGLLFCCSVFLFLRNFSGITLSSSMKSLDKCSMGIYIVHHILIQEMNGIDCFRALMTEHYILYPLMQFLVITLVSWYIVVLLKKNSLAKYVVG